MMDFFEQFYKRFIMIFIFPGIKPDWDDMLDLSFIRIEINHRLKLPTFFFVVNGFIVKF